MQEPPQKGESPQKLEVIDDLPPADQRAVLKFVDALVASHRRTAQPHLNIPVPAVLKPNQLQPPIFQPETQAVYESDIDNHIFAVIGKAQS